MCVLARIPAGSWPVVMGAGIVSVDLLQIGQLVASAVLAWLAVAVWILLIVRLVVVPERIRPESTSPTALGAVAATAVLGSRFAAQQVGLLAVLLLALAACGLVLLPWPVLTHWKRPSTGASFLLTVAAAGVAVLSVAVAVLYRVAWLAGLALVVTVAGLVGYCFVAWQFDRREIITGAGDHWVAGGAVAISALAVGKIAASGLGLAWRCRRTPRA